MVIIQNRVRSKVVLKFYGALEALLGMTGAHFSLAVKILLYNSATYKTWGLMSKTRSCTVNASKSSKNFLLLDLRPGFLYRLLISAFGHQ
jgi:hypothetical protein